MNEDNLILERYVQIFAEAVEEESIFSEDKYGNKTWRNKQGLYHRTDGPAILTNTGVQFWYINGKLHREDGPAVVYKAGHEEYYINGKLHREDGPAVIDVTSGYRAWFLDNLRHRTNGPAVIWGSDFNNEIEYWVNGKNFTQDEYYAYIINNIIDVKKKKKA